LATLHRLGVILWGGPKWTKYQKFHHPGVKLIDFSPCEKYVVTYSQQAEQESKDQAIIIWDVITGQKMRAFANLNPAWPAFKWSYDDKFFARVNEEGALSVYETNTFSLLNKKSYKLDAAIHDFAWSPNDNIISAWVAEYNNVPARVFLLQVPQLTVMSQKNLYNVIDCKMHWQGAGDYLCVKVDRHAGKNKAKIAVTNFELFRMREKGLPIEVLELKDEIVIAFAWEPKDKRFALIHCPEDSPRTNVSFYTMAGKQYKHLKTLEKRSANHLFWSPAGKYILIAGLRNFNGVLEFFNVQELETITTEDHFNCTNIEWDPTGRYVATYVSFWRHPLENGYNLWTFSGKHLHREYREKFYQLLWRPRPPSLLSKEVEENIKKNFKQISEKYRKEDEGRAEAARIAELERKAKLRSDFEDLLRQRWAEYKADAPKRRAITGHDDSDEENEYLLVEEDVEEVIDEQVIEEF
jgi:translation initiation factor 3 subunit B